MPWVTSRSLTLNTRYARRRFLTRAVPAHGRSPTCDAGKSSDRKIRPRSAWVRWATGSKPLRRKHSHSKVLRCNRPDRVALAETPDPAHTRASGETPIFKCGSPALAGRSPSFPRDVPFVHPQRRKGLSTTGAPSPACQQERRGARRPTLPNHWGVHRVTVFGERFRFEIGTPPSASTRVQSRSLAPLRGLNFADRAASAEFTPPRRGEPPGPRFDRDPVCMGGGNADFECGHLDEGSARAAGPKIGRRRIRLAGYYPASLPSRPPKAKPEMSPRRCGPIHAAGISGSLEGVERKRPTPSRGFLCQRGYRHGRVFAVECHRRAFLTVGTCA